MSSDVIKDRVEGSGGLAQDAYRVAEGMGNQTMSITAGRRTPEPLHYPANQR